MEAQKDDSDADVIDFAGLWRSLWSYKYLISSAFVLCVAGAIFLALSATPIYRAQVVLVEVEDPGAGGGMSSLVSQFGGLASLAGVNLPSGRGNGQSRAVLESRQAIEEFLRAEGRMKQLSGDQGKAMSLWLAVKHVQEQVISIEQNTRSGRITVAVEWKDPEIAAAWANEFVKFVNERIRMRAIEEASKNIAYLKAQIAQTSIAELQRLMYNIVQSETQRLMLANARTDYAFEIVDPAVSPEQRVRPQRTLMVTIGAIVGIFLGLVLAFLHGLVVRARRGPHKK